jgi:hypothetical protein
LIMSLRKVSLPIAAALAGLALAGPRAIAGFVPPSGLAPGSQYQIAFFTADGTTISTNGESFYNSFVTTEAAPLTAVLPAGTIWDAITSTYDSGSGASPIYTNAYANAPAYANIPIYNTAGQLVASGAAQFYSAVAWANPIDYDQTGILNTIEPFTGSNDDGSADLPFVLGDDPSGLETEFGNTGQTLTGRFSAGFFATNEVTGSLYALSSPITVPEPACLAALGIPAAMGLLRRRRRGITGR